MVIAQEDFPPVFDTLTDFPGGYAVETRGLWKMQNDFMNEDKMGYLRQLEAIFFGLQYNSQADNHKPDSPV